MDESQGVKRINDVLSKLGSPHRVKVGDEIYEGLISAFEAIATRFEQIEEGWRLRQINNIPGSSFS